MEQILKKIFFKRIMVIYFSVNIRSSSTCPFRGIWMKSDVQPFQYDSRVWWSAMIYSLEDFSKILIGSTFFCSTEQYFYPCTWLDIRSSMFIKAVCYPYCGSSVLFVFSQIFGANIIAHKKWKFENIRFFFRYPVFYVIFTIPLKLFKEPCRLKKQWNFW